jgi:hypothetical protein
MTMFFNSYTPPNSSSQAYTDTVRAYISVLLCDPREAQRQTNSDELSNAYCQAMLIIWNALAPWISSVGAHAVLVRAFSLTSRSRTFLQSIRLTEAGVDPLSIQQSLEGVDCDDALSALTETVTCLLEVLESIAGDVLVRVVLERIQLAIDEHIGR